MADKMVDNLELRLADWAFEGEKSFKVVQILLNGKDFIEMLREIEKPYAEAEGKPHLAGDYGYVSPKHLYRELTKMSDGAELLCCGGCGDSGCWSVMVSVREDDEYVYWENFEQNHRDWEYSLSYKFEKKEYDQVMEMLKEFVEEN
uniref:hypothetical protein n=1 Tax=Acetatifactor sp. TaxID=1872090 RepID=UPI00405623EC